MFKKSNFVILSAEKGELNYFHNAARTQEMRGILEKKSMEFIEVDGVYKGRKEKSFAVKINNNQEINFIKRLALYFGQESILAVDSKNRTMLIYMNNDDHIKLGTFKKVPKSVADNLDAYTMTESGYYAC